MRIDHNVVIQRYGVWHVNYNLNRCQYKNTPGLTKSPLKKMLRMIQETLGLNHNLKKVNKEYHLKTGEFANFLDGLNNAGTNITHNSKSSFSSSTLKRSYEHLIEDCNFVMLKKTKFYVT